MLVCSEKGLGAIDNWRPTCWRFSCHAEVPLFERLLVTGTSFKMFISQSSIIAKKSVFVPVAKPASKRTYS